MAALPEASVRRRRYTRAATDGCHLTPRKLVLLQTVAQYGLASLPQLAKLTCPSEQSARRHLRELFDAGLVEVIPVPRVLLAGPDHGNDASLLYGSAPNVFAITRVGRKLLREMDLTDTRMLPQSYGPRNSLFLAHELAIRDVRVWLALCARMHEHTLDHWIDGPEAEIDLQRTAIPKVFRPDAWFRYRLAPHVLVGFVEVDRGTERGAARWQEKLTGYGLVFDSGRLRALTGYVNARVLVVAPTAHRRDSLTEFIAARASPTMRSRYWLTEQATLQRPGVHHTMWRQPGSDELRALVPPDLLCRHELDRQQ